MRPLKPGMAEARKRIKKAHSKAKGATFFYLIGTLALFVLSFFQSLNVSFMGVTDKGTGIDVTNFFKPIVGAIKGDLDIMSLIIMALYIIIILVTFICFIICVRRRSRVARRGSGNILLTNNSMSDMDEAGNAFSAAFATFIINYFLIYMLSGVVPPYDPKAADNTNINFFAALTIFGYIALGVGLLIHFIGGCLVGSISSFAIDGTIDEKKRESKLSIFFFRNLLQTVATAALLFLFSPTGVLYIEIPALVAGEESALLNFNDIMGVIPIALQLLTVIWLVVLIKHTTANTEFNRDGMDGDGMCVYRVFAFLTFVCCAGLFVLDKTEAGEWIFNYAFAAGVAFVIFLLDLIIKPRKKAVDTDEISVEFDGVVEEEPVKKSKKDRKKEKKAAKKAEKKGKVQPRPQPQPVAAPAPMAMGGCPYMMPPCPGSCMPCAVAPQMPMASTGSSNALYLSEQERRRLKNEKRDLQGSAEELKYAEKQNKVNKKQEKRNMKNAKKLAKKEGKFAKTLDAVEPIEEVATPEVAPVSDSIDLKISLPKELFPQKSPIVVPMPSLPSEANGNDIDYVDADLGLPVMLEVKCPTCAKALSVKSTVPYHRCPACGKVFQIRKGKKVPMK